MSKPRFEIYPSPDGDWRFTLVAANGEPLASGEGYGDRRGAVRGAAALARNAARAAVVFVEEAPSRRKLSQAARRAAGQSSISGPSLDAT